ncbi:interferon-inducible GTPase-domain-containing protein [Suillus subalutaceus]|uniref:interferon-inducible GTPase-domain-containing protein n=1 Tax=Suillus subalutaceus TaxID=48586 RepID=UPI001B86223E|nr:interferon-inducible GTPase-domain-containing protein [Suillus subalutaceus]KAG1851440.1 interferon-inducible GTPase-domain-containing protein [Suillus subalutaceus]
MFNDAGPVPRPSFTTSLGAVARGCLPATLLFTAARHNLQLKIELAEMPESVNTAKREVEEEKRANCAAKRTAENAQRRQEGFEQAAAETPEALRRAEEARFAIERWWFEGVRSECRPLEEDIIRMKTKYRYSPGFLHLAVVGSSGGGKSSFINAVRGLSNNDPIAARTGIVETTNAITRYTDPRPDSQIFWYDIPGAGTPNMPDWQYFNNLGLYIFDCIIVLIDNRFLDSDLAILRACEQFTNIEVFIVRSKSDQHINNMASDRMPCGFDPLNVVNETRSRFQQIKSETQRKFIDQTHQNLQMNLKRNNISPKKVYIVCKDAMRAVWNNSSSPMAIDEEELKNDIAECVRRRLY